MGRPQDVSPNIAAATTIIQSDEELKQKPHKWYYYLWDTLDKPKEERWFMFKLDAALLTFASLGVLLRISLVGSTTDCVAGYFIKYLDQMNISSAFVSGMYVLVDHQRRFANMMTGRKTLDFTAINSTICRHAGQWDMSLVNCPATSC
jgi:hypothetical protein